MTKRKAQTMINSTDAFKRMLAYVADLEGSTMSQIAVRAVTKYVERKHNLKISTFSDTAIRQARMMPAEIIQELNAQKTRASKYHQISKELENKLNNARQIFQQFTNIEPPF